MRISYGPSIDRGVTQLMYVGDDAPAAPNFRLWVMLAIAGIGAYMILGSSSAKRRA